MLESHYEDKMIWPCKRNRAEEQDRSAILIRGDQNATMEMVRACMRMPNSRLPMQAISWTPTVRRNVGRPKNTWRRTVKHEMRDKNLDQSEVVAIAQDRSAWRNFVAGLWTTWGVSKYKSLHSTCYVSVIVIHCKISGVLNKLFQY